MWNCSLPHCRYILFWIVILACKFSFSYFLQVVSSDTSKKVLLWETNLIQSNRISEVTYRSGSLTLQIKTMVGPTRTIVDLTDLNYRWRDVVSKSASLKLLYNEVLPSRLPVSAEWPDPKFTRQFSFSYFFEMNCYHLRFCHDNAFNDFVCCVR